MLWVVTEIQLELRKKVVYWKDLGGSSSENEIENEQMRFPVADLELVCGD